MTYNQNMGEKFFNVFKILLLNFSKLLNGLKRVLFDFK